MYQKTTLIGKIGKIEFGTTPAGKSVTTYQVATTEAIKDKQTGNWEEKTEWHRCKSFSKAAGYVQDNLKVGDLVVLTGKKETTVSINPSTQIKRYFTHLIVFDFPKKLPSYWKKPDNLTAPGLTQVAAKPTTTQSPVQSVGDFNRVNTMDEDEFFS